MKYKSWIIPLITVIVVAVIVVVNNKQDLDEYSSSSRTEGVVSTENKVPQSAESTNSSPYQDYESSLISEASTKKVVLFFHAAWCPTCQQAEQEIVADINSLPSDLLLLKVDYDSNTALRRKYNVPYQHYFVQVDADGNQIKAWSGGSVPELISNPV